MRHREPPLPNRRPGRTPRADLRFDDHEPCLDAPIVHIPVPSLAPLAAASVAMGIAQGALDDIVALAVEKVPLLAAGPLAANPLFQFDLATADTELRAARALVYETAEAAWHTAVGATSLTLEERARIRAAGVWATERAGRGGHHRVPGRRRHCALRGLPAPASPARCQRGHAALSAEARHDDHCRRRPRGSRDPRPRVLTEPVGKGGLEPPTSCSQSRCAANCATSRHAESAAPAGFLGATGARDPGTPRKAAGRSRTRERAGARGPGPVGEPLSGLDPPPAPALAYRPRGPFRSIARFPLT